MPDSTKNSRFCQLSEEIADALPVSNTINQEKTSTTPVRSAVARSESVSWMPILARMAVIPAKKADRNAKRIHIIEFPPFGRSITDIDKEYLKKRRDPPPF